MDQKAVLLIVVVGGFDMIINFQQAVKKRLLELQKIDRQRDLSADEMIEYLSLLVRYDYLKSRSSKNE